MVIAGIPTSCDGTFVHRAEVRTGMRIGERRYEIGCGCGCGASMRERGGGRGQVCIKDQITHLCQACIKALTAAAGGLQESPLR